MAAAMRQLCATTASGLGHRWSAVDRVAIEAAVRSEHTSSSAGSCPVMTRELDASDSASRIGGGATEANAIPKGVKSMHELDGPPGLPIVGNFLSYLKKENQGRMHEVQARHHKTYGRMFREKWGSNWQVHISDPDLMQEVFRKDGRYPNRPSIQAWVLYRNTFGKSQGLVTAQGKEWQAYRAEFGRRMMDPKVTQRFTGSFNDVSDDLVKRLRYVRDKEGDLALVKKLPNEMYKWSLEAAAAFLFETRLGCLDVEIPERTQEFIDATQDMMAATLYLIIGEKLHKRLNTRYWIRHKLAWDKIFEIGKELIDKRVSALGDDSLAAERSGEREPMKGLYLTHLLPGHSQNLTMEQIYSNVTDILLAGSDTTANSFCFILHLLANNPDALARASQECATVLQGRQLITTSDLDNLKYLRCVLKEAMRLYPIITMNCRILEEDIILNGYFVPKKTLFVLNNYASGRDEACFAEADRFLPERWYRDEQGASKSHPFACLPFGHGQRSCMGRRVGQMELMILLAKVLQNFDLEVYPNVELKPLLRTLLTPGSHVPVRLTNRAA